MAVQLRDVGIRFDAHATPAVEGVSLDVGPGQFVSLVGPSGCGKSTLLRAIARMVVPTAGTVELLPATAASAARAGFVFQHPHLLPWRDVLGNIGLPLELTGIPSRSARAAAAEVCDLVDLGTVDHAKLPRMLSGGMQMRVSLARALVTRPALMLMDEPFAAIDDLLRQQLNIDVLRLWQEQGWTCVFVTHHLDEALFMAQRVIVMASHPGRIQAEIPVPCPYPRSRDWRTSGEFVELLQRLDAALRMPAP